MSIEDTSVNGTPYSNPRNMFHVNLRIEGSDMEKLDSGEFSIIIADSIYSFLPEIDISLGDDLGTYVESRLLTNGIRIRLDYGGALDSGDTWMPLTQKTGEVMSQSREGVISGDLSMAFEHRLKNLHGNKEPKAFLLNGYGNSQSIVKKMFGSSDLIRNKNFYIQNPVDCLDWVYSPSVEPDDFVDNYLLPNSYVKDNDPCFCFINAQNDLCFYDLEGLVNLDMNRKVIETEIVENDYIIYMKNLEDNKAFLIPMLTFFPYTLDYDVVGSTIDMYASSFMNGDDSMTHTDMSEKGSYGDFTIVHRDDGGEYSFYASDRYLDERAGQRFRASLDFGRRKQMFTDRAMASFPINLDICAGMTIRVKNVSYGGAVYSNSETYTGNWLVEESRHVWDGVNRTGKTTVSLARIGATYPKDYLYSNERYGA